MTADVSRDTAPARHARLAAFVRDVVAPRAGEFDADGAVPRAVLERVASAGQLVRAAPAPGDVAALTDLHRRLGAASASVQSLLTVHGMVCDTVCRQATPGAREAWLSPLTSGEALGAFALTEDGAGNDTDNLTTTVDLRDGHVQVDGEKRWVSFGRVADVFLVFGRDAACLVDRRTPGVTVAPEAATSGFRAAMLARVRFERCAVTPERLITRSTLGVRQVMLRCLTLGRLWVAWGAIGLGELARDRALAHVAARRRSTGTLSDLQLVRGRLTDVAVGLAGARLLCERASRSLADDDDAVLDAMTAKLAASRAARHAADAAGQLHGAVGLCSDSVVDRLVRDARVLEIIEGGTELLQDVIARSLLARWRASPPEGE